MPVYRSGCNALMMRFQAVQAGLKLSHHFTLPFHHPCCPAVCAASPAAQAPAVLPTTMQRLPLTFLPLFGGYIMGEKIKFSSQTCSILWALHTSEDLLVYLIVTGMIFSKVQVFGDFPRAIAALVQPSSRNASRRTEVGWQWGTKPELALTGVDFAPWKLPEMIPLCCPVLITLGQVGIWLLRLFVSIL